MLVRRIAIPVLFAATVLVASAAKAQPTFPLFRVEVFAAGGGVQDTDTQEGAVPQSSSAGPVSASFATGSSSAASGYCRLTGTTNATVSAPTGMTSGSASGRTKASFQIDDLVFSGPGGSVTVNGLNFRIEGALTASVTPPQNIIEFARVDTDVVVGASSVSFARLDYVGSTGTASVTDGGLLSGIGTLTTTSSGATLTFDDALTSSSFNATIGLPLQLLVNLDLQGNAGLTTAAGGTGVAATDFGTSLTLPGDGPVFNLPPGYTANSAQARIFDNRCLSQGHGVPALSWPGLGLLAACVVMVAGVALRAGASPERTPGRAPAPSGGAARSRGPRLTR